MFGSGMQALGSLLAVIRAAWFIQKSEFLRELNRGMRKPIPFFLFWWMRVVIPVAILIVGLNWIRESLF